MSINGQMDKEDIVCMCIHTHTHTHACTHTMEYYLTIKKNEILPFVITWMDPEGIRLSEISQTEKDKYYMTFTYMWNLKSKPKQSKQTNKARQKQRHRYREQTGGFQRGSGWRAGQNR